MPEPRDYGDKQSLQESLTKISIEGVSRNNSPYKHKTFQLESFKDNIQRINESKIYCAYKDF